MTGDFISTYLKRKFGVETIIPQKEYLEQNHLYIAEELTKGIFSREARDFYLEQMNLLRERSAEGIILGCTELPMLLDQKDFDMPLLDTTQLHAKLAVDFILKEFVP